MAQITKSLSLDVSRQNRRRAILAKQFDNGSRFLNIQLNNEGEPITVAQNSVVLINATRADGASESFVGGVNDDGSVTVPITYWMLEVPDKVMCDVSVISELESKLSTLGFAIEVEKANGTGDDIAETEDCGILVQLISDVKRLEDNFKSVFVRYSANADGTDYSDVWSDGMQYIGIANTDTEPSDKSGYIWCKFAADAKESNVTVDAELSLESENPVQNKAVTQEFKAFNDAVGEINRRVSSLESGGVGGGSGGVTSWNDLTDKPFGENEDGTVKQLDNKYLEPFDGIDAEELLPSRDGQSSLTDLGIYAISSNSTEEMFDRWHGNGDNTIMGNIFVEFDGITYECAQQRLTELDGGVAVGNCTAFGGTGNNEPFIITMIAGTNQDENGNVTDVYVWMIAALTDTAPAEHQYRVYQPFDEPKYMLKEECLPFDAIAAYIDNYIDEALGGDY